jgi:hypothetical protein
MQVIHCVKILLGKKNQKYMKNGSILLIIKIIPKTLILLKKYFKNNSFSISIFFL